MWLKGYVYSSCYYHHQIGSIHFSHSFHIFPGLCAWDVCLHHILSLIAYTFREFVVIIIVQFMMCANIWIRFGLQILLVCLYSTPSHYHHCANLSEGIVRYILSSVWVRLSIFSPCGAVCFQFTHFSFDDWENIYTLSYHHHQIGSMNYYPLFRVRSWNNGVRCMSPYILMTQKERLIVKCIADCSCGFKVNFCHSLSPLIATIHHIHGAIYFTLLNVLSLSYKFIFMNWFCDGL